MGLLDAMREVEDLKAEVERLKAALAEADADRLVKQGHIDALEMANGNLHREVQRLARSLGL